MINSFQLGPFTVHFYGLLIVSGIILAAWMASKEAKRRGHNPAIVWDMLLWLMIAGIIGARLWHVFTPSASSIEAGITTHYYLSNPLRILMLWKGGLGIPGAVIGGAIALFFYARTHGLNFWVWADIAVPSLALGQAIGRWGNYFNQELYGAPTALPWKLYIDAAHRLKGFEAYEYFHPLFLYESLWNLGNMALLIWLSRRLSSRLKDGDLLFVYLIVYPLGRFLLDFLRLDTAMINGIDANQTFMAMIALFAITALLWRHRKQPATA